MVSSLFFGSADSTTDRNIGSWCSRAAGRVVVAARPTSFEMGTAPCQWSKLADTIWAPIAGPKRGPWRARHHSGVILALAGSFAFGGGWLQMRTSKARTREETEGRLHLLDAQRES